MTLEVKYVDYEIKRDTNSAWPGQFVIWRRAYDKNNVLVDVQTRYSDGKHSVHRLNELFGEDK